MPPHPTRTEATPLIGAHVSVAGGLATGGLRYAAAVGAEAIQLFVANPRAWAAPPGDPSQDEALRAAQLPIYVHASHLINLGSAGGARKSIPALAHALGRGAEIGARGVVCTPDPRLARTGTARWARWPRGCCRCWTSWAMTVRTCCWNRWPGRVRCCAPTWASWPVTSTRCAGTRERACAWTPATCSRPGTT